MSKQAEGKGPLTANVTLDDERDVATVYGLRISGVLFRTLAEPTPEGRWLRVVKVEDGIATIEQRTDLVPIGLPNTRAPLAEILADGWKEIAAFFQDRNWPDTKLGNAASAIDWRIGEMVGALRQDRNTRQRRVAEFVRTRLGEANMGRKERAARVLEEALEIAQAEGLSITDCAKLGDHVYSKPVGEPSQEAGGLGVALLGYAAGIGVSADTVEAAELERIVALPVEYFRQRHNAKAAAGVALSTPMAGPLS